LSVARINVIELPAANLASTKTFYESAFGWELTAFGTFACTVTGDVDLGLQGDAAEATRAPMAIVDVDDIEQAAAAVEKSGGTITKPIFEIPGGKRFHFTDPSGNELGVVQAD
jgi:uncharacterized protein